MPKQQQKSDDADWYNKKYKSSTSKLYCWNEKIFELIQKSTAHNKKIKFLEIGCGAGNLLKKIHAEIGIKKDNLYGIEQSETATFKPKNEGFKNIKCADAKKIPFRDNFFDIIIMAEVIEHLRDREFIMKEIKRMLKNEGVVILSFPNYLNLPWLLLRYLAKVSSVASKMINLQPYDRIYTYFGIIDYMKTNELNFLESHGTNYLPPGMHLIESMKFSNSMTRLGLTFLSFHPILKFQYAKNNKRLLITR